MRGTRRAVIALVWLLGTGAATAITIEGVRVVGSKVINGESAISPRQANAALSGRTTTTFEVPVTTEAVTTTVTTELPTTVVTEPPTTALATEPVTTVRAATPTTRKKTVVSSPITAKPTTTSPPATSPPTVTTKPAAPPTNPPTTPSPPTTPKATTTVPAPSPCIQQVKFTEGGYVTACFTAQKVTVVGMVASKDWRPAQLSSGAIAVVQFTKEDHTITVTALWNGGPAWMVSQSH